MMRILSRRAISTAVMIVLVAAGGAAAQEPERDAADASVSLSRLSANAFVIASDGPTRAHQGGAEDDNAKKEPHRWDAIKTGFYAGLAIGGVVGIALVTECGHPECGPLLTLAAGIGATIGMGIDALIDRRPAIEGVSAHDHPSRGRRLSIALRKSW